MAPPPLRIEPGIKAHGRKGFCEPLIEVDGGHALGQQLLETTGRCSHGAAGRTRTDTADWHEVPVVPPAIFTQLAVVGPPRAIPIHVEPCAPHL